MGERVEGDGTWSTSDAGAGRAWEWPTFIVSGQGRGRNVRGVLVAVLRAVHGACSWRPASATDRRFRSIPYIFPKEQAGPVLGWTSAIAAYGAFMIPIVFGQQIKAGLSRNRALVRLYGRITWSV
jgi:nitrate/nitrite transporter NarK